MDRGSIEPLAYGNRAPSMGGQGTMPGGQKEVSSSRMNMINNKTWTQWTGTMWDGVDSRRNVVWVPGTGGSSKRRSANGWWWWWCCTVFGEVQHGNNRTTQP
ncbi:hypothetical protein COCMIDRAFT_29954 [Bipolaris oryzae ATCC 44560]|uniref:Uncharacterized protein n=1 Tax=Bipolaris oryzae ATCC 44560 TaxID=930090 RepID=W6Z0N5_COCMI|nr:uncharacterized protein COCMIDRAFT_29954 [Bipolaris oryzae ATCC 44560]EUC41234.1 hypothetical protein COCMIDRAFT_29954 [Bipolaris oryzae ATCC 44560]